MRLRAVHQVVLGTCLAVAATTSLWIGAAPPAVDAAGSSEPALVPTDPARFLETRIGDDETTFDGRFEGVGKAPAGSVLELQVAGRGDVPADAEAVVLNLAAVFPDDNGYLQAYPCGTARSITSNVNYFAGQVVAGAALTKIGDDGTVCIFTLAATDVIADVTAYVPAGGSLTAVEPARLAESRTDPGATTTDGMFTGFGRLAAGSTLEVPVAARGDVPADADAAVVSVAAILPAGPGVLTVYACDAPLPDASTINYPAGGVVANMALTRVSSTGTICIHTLAEIDVIVDVTGFVPAGGALPAIAPARLLETRADLPTFDGESEAIGRAAAGSEVELLVTGRAGVPDDAQAVVLNLAAILPDEPGYLAVYPCGTERPTSSTLNYSPGQIIANAVVAKVGADGTVCVFTLSAVDIIADVTGYVPADVVSGTLTIVADSTPDDAQDFVFTSDVPGAETFTLDDDADPALSNTLVTSVDPGTYAVSEAVPAGWDVTSATCSDGSPVTAIEISDGESVTCTFANAKLGTIILEKQTIPDGSIETFTFTGDLAGDVGDGETLEAELLPGTYTATEIVPAGWGIADITCDDTDSSGDTAIGVVTFEVDGGETVRCVVTNALLGSITVVKDTVGADGSFDFSGDLGAFGLTTAANTASATTTDLMPGTYAISETDPAPTYSLTALDCVDPDGGTTADLATLTATIDLDPGEDVTCTFTNSESGSITITKNTFGGDGMFDFSSDLGPFTIGTAGNTGSTTLTGVAPGTYDVTEDPNPAFQLTGMFCNDPDGGSTFDLGTRTATFDVDPGESVSCGFTNTELGTIIVEKQTLPDGDPQSFAFTGDAAGSIADDGTLVVAGLLPGTYTSAETVPLGWALTDITCDDANSTGSTGTATATFNVEPGETVTCVFTNTKLGSILVEKQTDPDAATATYTFTGDAAGTIGDGGQIIVNGLLPGTYTSTENDPAPAFDLTNIVCDDANSSGDVGTRTATFNVEPGETVTCVFTNTQRGTIVVEKQTLPDGSPQTFTFTGDAAGTIGDGGTITVNDLVPGTYTSTETALAGFELTDITCDDGNSTGDTTARTATFTLEPGETVTCVFTNTELGQLSFTKQTLPDNAPGLFSFTGAVSGSLSDDTGISIPVVPGVYEVTETARPGWVLTDITCDDTDSTGDVGTRTATFNIDPGEDVNCVFTNTELGSITIQTNSIAGDGVFSFTGDLGAFDLDTTGTGTASTTFDSILPGSLDVTESDPSPADLTALACNDGGSATPSTTSLATRTATIELDPGEDVICTFTNSFNLPPTAVDDSYSVPVNVVLDAGGASAGAIEASDADGVLTKGTDDSDPNGDALTVTQVNGGAFLSGNPITLASGATLTMFTDGTFTYLSAPATAATSDSFTYTASDGIETDVATVTITLGETIWFIDNEAGGTGGTGTSNDPFRTIADFNAATTDTGDLIHLATGTYATGIVLIDGQRLLGEGVALTSGALSIAAGTRPTITSTTSNGVQLATNATTANTVRGLDIGNTPGHHAFAGTNPGTPTIDAVDISGSGGIIEFNGGNVSGIAFGNQTSTSSPASAAIDLVNVTGNYAGGAPVISNAAGAGIRIANYNSSTVTFAGGSITATGAEGIVISGGNGSATIATAVTQTTGTNSVRVFNKNGGTVNFTGPIDDDRNGISLTGNAGAAINFSGGLDLDTTTNTAFTATGGGTVTVTPGGSGNHATATTGSGVVASGVSIGVLFNSVQSVGAANVGISLTNTTGFFTVTGSSVGCQSNAGACSGGSITGKTGNGIVLSNVTNVTLNDMNISNNADNGIVGTNVNGLTLDDLRIDGNANQFSPDEAGVNLTGLIGTATISNTTISNSFEHNAIVTNSSGTLTNLAVSGSTFGPNPTGSGANGLLFEMTGGTHTLTVTGSTFTDNKSNGIQATASAGTINVNVSTSSFTSSSQAPDQGQNVAVNIATSGTANTNFDIVDNPVIEDHRSNAINVFSNGSGTVSGTVQGNTIGTAGDQSSGSLLGDGVRVANEGTGTTTVRIDNNTIQEIGELFLGGGFGISVSESVGAGTTNVTVTSNIVDQVRDNRAMRLSAIVAGGTMCSLVTGNTFTNFDLAPQLRQAVSGVHNNTSANEADLEAANGGVDFSISGTINFGGAACATP